MAMHHNYRQDYIHHQKSDFRDQLKEIVFGMEDGMVSTLGSITGIAVGSKDHYTVILAGLVIIAVESVSMGIGSFLSNRSKEEVDQRKLEEEKDEIIKYPREEKIELKAIYLKEGWPERLATEMSETAAANKQLILNEMALHELKVFPTEASTSIKGGLYMFVAYVIGGLAPLFAYFILPMERALPISIGVTLVGLFALGAGTTKFTKQPFAKAGARMLLVGGLALVVGLIAGTLVREY